MTWLQVYCLIVGLQFVTLEHWLPAVEDIWHDWTCAACREE